MTPLEQLFSGIEDLKSTHVFLITNTGTGKNISKGYTGKFRSQNVWSYEDITKKYGSVKEMLQAFKDNNIPGINIQFNKKNGTGHLKTDIDPVTVHFSQPTKQMDNNTTSSEQAAAVMPNLQQTPANGLHGGQFIPLGLPQYMDFMKKEQRLELIEKENKRLERENLDLVTANKKIQTELDEAKSKCSLSDRELEFERKKIQSETKPFHESEAFKSLIEIAPSLLMSMKGGAAAQMAAQPGLSGSAAAEQAPSTQGSEMQQQLISVILDSNPTDEITLNMYQIFKAVMEDQSLLVQINQYIPTE